ncbi:SPAC12B10.15c, partial [Mucuna pruriens]
MEKAASIDLKRDGKGMEDLSGRVHQLPCCVKHDGPASVSHYFKPKPAGVGDEGLPLQLAHFRGRLLQGTTLQLPHGFVLSKKTSPPSSQHSWDTNATFQDITYWNHDYVPSHNDELFRAFHWLSLAKAVKGGIMQYPPPSESDMGRQKAKTSKAIWMIQAPQTFYGSSSR